MLCKRGLHTLNPDDPWRSASGYQCRPCWLAANRRYNTSEKGHARERRYERPFESRVGMALAHRRRQALKRRAERRARGHD